MVALLYCTQCHPELAQTSGAGFLIHCTAWAPTVPFPLIRLIGRETGPYWAD